MVFSVLGEALFKKAVIQKENTIQWNENFVAFPSWNYLNFLHDFVGYEAHFP